MNGMYYQEHTRKITEKEIGCDLQLITVQLVKKNNN